MRLSNILIVCLFSAQALASGSTGGGPNGDSICKIQLVGGGTEVQPNLQDFKSINGITYAPDRSQEGVDNIIIKGIKLSSDCAAIAKRYYDANGGRLTATYRHIESGGFSSTQGNFDF